MTPLFEIRLHNLTNALCVHLTWLFEHYSPMYILSADDLACGSVKWTSVLINCSFLNMKLNTKRETP